MTAPAASTTGAVGDEKPNARTILVVVHGDRELAEAAMRAIEAHDLAGCVVVSSRDLIDVLPSYGRFQAAEPHPLTDAIRGILGEVTADLRVERMVKITLAEPVLPDPALFLREFREEPRRDWEQRERQRPRKRRGRR